MCIFEIVPPRLRSLCRFGVVSDSTQTGVAGHCLFATDPCGQLGAQVRAGAVRNLIVQAAYRSSSVSASLGPRTTLRARSGAAPMAYRSLPGPQNRNENECSSGIMRLVLDSHLSGSKFTFLPQFPP
jgi:hypothetical protein